LCHFKFLTMINTTVGAGAASRYGSGSGSGSDQKRRLLAAPAPAPQHCFEDTNFAQNWKEKEARVVIFCLIYTCKAHC
jgi:hypothetical protein